MKLLTYQLGALQTNCYILIDEQTNDAVAVDIGGDEGFLMMESLKHGFKIKNVLLTHAHFDHIGGVYKFFNSGAKVYIGSGDLPAIKQGDLNLSTQFGFNVKPFEAVGVRGGDKLTFGEIEVEVIETPGHTVGGVTYKVGDMLFCGDTLFEGSFGRVDFPGGNAKILINSAKKLFDYSGFTLYPGHGGNTLVDVEKQTNPIRYYYDKD